jgi:hypothetical protein
MLGRDVICSRPAVTDSSWLKKRPEETFEPTTSASSRIWEICASRDDSQSRWIHARHATSRVPQLLSIIISISFRRRSRSRRRRIVYLRSVGPPRDDAGAA